MGQITDKAAETYRDYVTAGVPASGPYDPRKSDIRGLFGVVDIAVAAVAAGTQIVSTVADRDAFYATEANQAKLVYVNNNNGSATDAANGVYEYVNGSARLAQAFYAGLTATVQPLVDDAEAAADRAEDARDIVVAATANFKDVNAPSYPVSTTDTASRIAEYVDTVGVQRAARSRVRVLNGVRPEALILRQKRHRANHLSKTLYVSTTLQSLAYTTFAGANITTTRRGRAIVAPFEVANPTAAQFVPATTIAQPDTGESPMFALVNEVYTLLERENGLTDDRHGLVMASGNNAFGGTDILANSKGTARYNRGLAQLQALVNAGDSEVISAGLFGMGGEVEQATDLSFATVKSRVQQLARDAAADHRAITGQAFDPVFMIDTVCAYVAGSNVRATPRAILSAAIDYFEGTSTDPVVHLGETYSLGSPKDKTGVHVNAEGSHAAGARGSLAIKRVFLDIDPDTLQNRRWPPMYIIGVRRLGNTVILQFRMRSPEASLVPFAKALSAYPDGSGIPAQQDYGFGVWDGSSLRALIEPKVVDFDKVAITLASGNMASGLRVSAGLDRGATKLLLHTGAACNLRDDYGDLVQSSLGFPLHNHLSPQGVTLGSGPLDFTRF